MELEISNKLVRKYDHNKKKKFGFRTDFRPTNGERLIQLMRRCMRTGQALFPLGIDSDIPRVYPWKELLATEAQTTWL